MNAAVSLTIDTSQAPVAYSGEFPMPNSGKYLYLIYDYRSSVEATLCYSTADLEDVCCNCNEPIPLF